MANPQQAATFFGMPRIQNGHAVYATRAPHFRTGFNAQGQDPNLLREMFQGVVDESVYDPVGAIPEFYATVRKRKREHATHNAAVEELVPAPTVKQIDPAVN